MKKLWTHYFIPQERNNHRASILKPNFLLFFLILYLLSQSVIKSLVIIKPGILGYSSEITSQKVLDQTNNERKIAGLEPLQYSSVLSQSAQKKAEDMFKNDYWAHNSPQGKTPWTFFDTTGYKYSIAGENLAKDFYNTDALIKAWMDSPTHKANIIHQKYQEIGIAVVNGTLGGIKTTLVIQHFGTPSSGQVTNNSKVENISELNVINNNILAGSNEKLINPLVLSKILSSIIFIVLVIILLIRKRK